MAGYSLLPRMGIALTMALSRVVRVMQLCSGGVYSVEERLMFWRG